MTPLRSLQTRLQAYLATIGTTPRRQEVLPGISVTTMSNITAQVSVELGQASGVPRQPTATGKKLVRSGLKTAAVLRLF